jgi:phage terminase small subunit
MNEIKELSDKHKLFVTEYVKNNCNGTKAYMAVYDVDDKSARRAASLLLTNIDIKEAVNTEIDRVLADKQELALQIVNEYKKIAFSNISNILDPATGECLINENTDTSVLESVQVDTLKRGEDATIDKIKYKLYNKLNALDSLAKLVVGFSEKHDVKVELTNFADWIKSVNAPKTN